MPKQTPVLSYEELEATLPTDNPYYQTPVEMTLRAINARLTGAEWSLWGYLQALDPYGDRLKDLPPVTNLAKAVGISERQCHRALNRLKELDLYYWEPVIIRGQNLAGKRAKKIRREQGKFSDEDKLTTLSSLGQSCHDDDKVVQMKTKLSSLGQSCLEQPPEPLPQADSKTPQTIQTYSDLNQTLSDSAAEFSIFLAGLTNEREREEFLEFGRNEAAKLKNPEIVLVDKWIAKNFEELHRKFKATETAQTTELDEKTKAKEEEILAKRKAADEFLASNRTSGVNQQCVPAPQKSAVQPQESAEPRKVSNQPEEGSKKLKLASKGFGVDPKLVEQLKANRKKSKKQITKEVVEDDRINDAAPYD